MLEYVTEIRVATESLLTIGSLWWTIRTLVVMASLRDRLKKEERTFQNQLYALQVSINKLRDSSRKMRDKIIPGQIHIKTQLIQQLDRITKEIEKTSLPDQIRLFEEVKNFYQNQPSARYFRSSEYVPMDESD